MEPSLDQPHRPAPTSREQSVDGKITIVEVGETPFVITPGLARVLLRIMRKAAVRRAIDLDVTPARDDDRP